MNRTLCDKCGHRSDRPIGEGQWRHGLCEPELPPEWKAALEAPARNEARLRVIIAERRADLRRRLGLEP